MTRLSAEACQPCRGDASPLDDATLTDCLAQLPGWTVTDRDAVRMLQKSYSVKPYPAALNFVQAVGELAEQENHHPEIILEWGKVTVSWWTHTIAGLHLNDCILAARCDELFEHSFTQDQNR